MSEWDVVEEKPGAKPVSSDWAVEAEKPAAPTPGTPNVADAFARPSFFDRLVNPRPRGEAPWKNIKAPPVGDIVKSFGEGAAEGGVYAVPGVGQAIGGFDLGRAGMTGIGNMMSDTKTPQPEPVAKSIVKALGIDYTPKTSQGEVANITGMLGVPTKAIEAATSKAPVAVESVVNKLREGAQFKPPKVINEQTKAAEIIADRLKQNQQTTGETPQQILDRVKKARAEGKPLSPADIGGYSTTALGSRIARAPGPARDYVRGFLNKRDEEAATRLTSNIEDTLAKGSVRDTVESLAEARSKQAAPLFDEAYKGGSTAPLEKQYHDAFTEASERADKASNDIHTLMTELNKAKAERISGDFTKPIEKIRGMEFKIAQKEKELAEASADKATTLEHLRQSQVDRVAGTPGAVWSPRIASLLKRPDIARAIQKGLKIEQDMAAAEGRVFNPTEYAIVGQKDGEAVIGKTPTMRLLASAKEGLDSILLEKGMRDDLTGRLTKEGLAVDKMRRALVSELRRLNPKYAEAVDKWAGHSANIRAIDYGRKVFANKPEDILADLKDMSSSEQEFARLGVADALREKLLKTGVSGDEAKSIIKSPWAREQLRPFFKSEDAFSKFVGAVTDERSMFEGRRAMIGGPQTAERVAEDASGLKTGAQVLRGATDLARGSYWNVIHTLINLKSNRALRNDPALNDAIAKLLFDPTADLSQIEKALPVDKVTPK